MPGTKRELGSQKQHFDGIFGVFRRIFRLLILEDGDLYFLKRLILAQNWTTWETFKKAYNIKIIWDIYLSNQQLTQKIILKTGTNLDS